MPIPELDPSLKIYSQYGIMGVILTLLIKEVVVTMRRRPSEEKDFELALVKFQNQILNMLRDFNDKQTEVYRKISENQVEIANALARINDKIVSRYFDDNKKN